MTHLRQSLPGVPGPGRGSPRAGRRALTALAASILLWAPQAAASPFVDVEYDLGDTTAISFISAIQGSTSTPPDGTLTGRQTIRYTGDSASGLAVGPVELITFNIYVEGAVVTRSIYTVNGGKTPVTLATSDLHVEFLSLTANAPTGQRLAGGTIDPGGAYGIFRVTGSQHCYLYCGVIGVPQSTPVQLVPDTFTALLPTLTGATGQPHTVRGTATGATFIVRPQGGFGVQVTATNFIVGREVQRTKVIPEPGTLPLAATGIAGLAIAGLILRRRSRARES